jgi:hypothetical protein
VIRQAIARLNGHGLAFAQLDALLKHRKVREKLVRAGGIEPTLLAEPDFKSGVCLHNMLIISTILWIFNKLCKKL